MATPSLPHLDRSALLALLDEQPDDVLQTLCRTIAQAAITAEFDDQIGAERYGRSEGRNGYRNGTRSRSLNTRLGTIDLQIPRPREGGYVPSFLEERKRSERALVAAVVEMTINGVSTRKVERVIKELGVAGMSKSQVSVLCAQLDGTVKAFRERALEGRYPYLMLDALYIKVRINDRVCSQAIVIAYAVNEFGLREVIGVDLVETESHTSWLGFLRSLVARGLSGVQLVVTDAHEGLKGAIAQVFSSARWQRCRVHFLRNILAHVPKHQKLEIAAAFRSILAETDAEAARTHAATIIKQHGKSLPKAMEILAGGLDDVLNFFAFPPEHHRKLWSTNPIEHLNNVLRKRTNVVGIFPNADSAIRLITMLLIEQTEDWLTERAYMSEDSMQSIKTN
jgi:putative transposase